MFFCYILLNLIESLGKRRRVSRNPLPLTSWPECVLLLGIADTLWQSGSVTRGQQAYLGRTGIDVGLLSPGALHPSRIPSPGAGLSGAAP